MRQAKAFIARPNRTLEEHLLELGKRDSKLVAGLLTGHCHVNRHRQILGISETGTCTKCGEDKKSSLQVLYYDPTLSGYRINRIGAYLMEPKEIAELPLRSLVPFMSAVLDCLL